MDGSAVPRRFLLGIDTGGTYTDAALIDAGTREVLQTAKALTTPSNLLTGILAAIDGLSDWEPGAAAMVSEASGAGVSAGDAVSADVVGVSLAPAACVAA